MPRTDGKLYGYLIDNADSMRHIILVLIALMALGGLLPAVMGLPAAAVGLSNQQAATATSAQNVLDTTPSMAAFMNDSWTPSTFVAPVEVATDRFMSGKLGKNTTQNSTYAIYDFLNNSKVAPAAESPVYSAAAAGKDKKVAWTGESIYQFLADSWSPSTPVSVYNDGAYTKHQMS
jgi:hypothetical protein